MTLGTEQASVWKKCERITAKNSTCFNRTTCFHVGNRKLSIFFFFYHSIAVVGRSHSHTFNYSPTSQKKKNVLVILIIVALPLIIIETLSPPNWKPNYGEIVAIQCGWRPPNCAPSYRRHLTKISVRNEQERKKRREKNHLKKKNLALIVAPHTTLGTFYWYLRLCPHLFTESRLEPAQKRVNNAADALHASKSQI